jgi:hypothetical protein
VRPPPQVAQLELPLLQEGMQKRPRLKQQVERKE